MRRLLVWGITAVGVALALHRVVRTGAYVHFGPRTRTGPGTAALRLAHAVRGDDDVLCVLQRLQQHLVACSNLARKRAQGAAARRFAARLALRHAGALAVTEALLATLGLEHPPHRATSKLERLCLQRLADLEATPDAGFDVAFVAGAVDEHESLLHLIDARLLGASRDPRVLARVEAVRSDLTVGTAEARALATRLQPTRATRRTPAARRRTR